MFYFDSNTTIPLQCAALVYWTVPATATFYVGTSGKKTWLPTKLQQITVISADKKCSFFNDKYNTITYQNLQHVQSIYTFEQ